MSQRIILVAITLFLMGCPSEPEPSSADAVTDVSQEPVRSYLLGVSLESYDPSANPPWVTNAELLGEPARGEVVVVPLSRIGIPWSAFDTDDNLPVGIPPAWKAAFDEMTGVAASLGLPTLLALSPVSAYGDLLTAEATDVGGELALDLQWKGYCYDPAQDGDSERWQRAYAGFVAWVAEHSMVEPAWIQLGSDVTFIERTCSREVYDGMKPWYAAAHVAVEATGSSAVTVVGVNVADLYGLARAGQSEVCADPFGPDGACLADHISLLDGIGGARIGLQVNGSTLLSDDAVEQLPPDWLSRIADLLTRPLSLLGVSMASRLVPTLDGVCTPLVDSDEAVQREFLRDVLSVADAGNVDLVAWDPVVDLLDGSVVESCPCAGDADVCFHFDLLGAKQNDLRMSATNGLFTYDGAPKLSGAMWMELLP